MTCNMINDLARESNATVNESEMNKSEWLNTLGVCDKFLTNDGLHVNLSDFSDLIHGRKGLTLSGST